MAHDRSFIINHNNKNSVKKVRLNNITILALFITSYIPLFGLLILRQIKQNIDFLNFGEFSFESFFLFIKKFGLASFLFLIAIFGYIGLRFLITNLEVKKVNGELVKITEIENKNNESIGYISTYIIPFIFQDTNNFFDIFSIFIVLIIIYSIYIKSNMITINPILNLSHTLYQIEYSKKGRKKKGLLIIKNEDLEVGQEIKINQITKNIYYG